MSLGPRGVVHVAVGNPRFLDEAITSATSVRARMPDLPLCLATDQRDVPDVFDTSIELPVDQHAKRSKILGLLRSPYERTLYLDTDAYVVADLSPLFGLLDDFDLAVAHSPGPSGLAQDDVSPAYAQLNTGVLAWRWTPSMRRFFEEWLEAFDRLSSGTTRDQPSFRRAAYFTDARMVTLTPDWNLRIMDRATGFSRPPKILHGRALGRSFEEIASVLNRAQERHERVAIRQGRVYAGRRPWPIADYGRRKRFRLAVWRIRRSMRGTT